jgi:hypothetical protein
MSDTFPSHVSLLASVAETSEHICFEYGFTPTWRSQVFGSRKAHNSAIVDAGYKALDTYNGAMSCPAFTILGQCRMRFAPASVAVNIQSCGGKLLRLAKLAITLSLHYLRELQPAQVEL